MAHYDPHRNRGYDGVYRAAIVDYSAKSESYMASTEQVVKLSSGGYPATHTQIWPRNSTRVQPQKGDGYDYSPKFSHVNDSPRNSPRKALHGAHSPPPGHYPSVYGANHNSPHDSPRKAHNGPHSPRPGHFSGIYGNNHNSPHDSPRKNFRANFSSTDDDSSDDEVECRDGVCYPKPKHGGNRQNGNYPMHSTDHQPRKDSHYQTSDPHKYYSTEKLPDGNNINSPNSYNLQPAHTKPMTDEYYDNRFSYPGNNERNNYTLPAPIKTKPADHHRDAKNSPVAAAQHWTPFVASPRKERQPKQEVIDSTEAHRRYGNAPPQSGAPVDYKYMAIIDSETAAKMYGGVFVKK